MLDLVCYLLAAVLWALAVVAPPVPGWDRARFIAAGLVAFVVPAVVHAAH